MKLFLFLLLVSSHSFAVFQQLYQGYLKSNVIESLNMEFDMSKVSFEYSKDKNDWELQLGTDYSDSFLQSLFSFQSNQTITNTYSVGFLKNSFKYGSFALTHKKVDYDLSNWSSSGFNNFSADKVHEVKNTVSYNYDFLKKPLTNEWDVIHTQKQVDDINTKVVLEKDSLNFFKSYLNTKLKVVLNRQYKEFEKRAKKRIRLVRKRVKDGLSRSVELDQSELSLLGQQETILKNQTLMKENIFLLEDIIGYKIPEPLYINIKWKYQQKNKFPIAFQEGKFLEIDQLKKSNHLKTLNLERIKIESGHSLKMNLGYTKNSVNEKYSDAFNDSLGGGNNDEKVASLIYSVPFGGDKRSASYKRLKLQQKKGQMDLKNFMSHNKVQKVILKHHIDSYESAIELGNKKLRIAKRSIRKTNDLYLRGQVSFEELLRSEETLLNAEISLVNQLALYEEALADLAYMNGHISQFLTGYTD